MKRRRFIESFSTLAALCSSGKYVWAVGERDNDDNYGTSETCPTKVNRIGKHTLAQLRDFHHKELDEKYIALCPDATAGYIKAARAYEALSDYNMAIEYYQKACDRGDKHSCIRINQIKTSTRRFIRDYIPFGDMFWNNPSKD